MLIFHRCGQDTLLNGLSTAGLPRWARNTSVDVILLRSDSTSQPGEAIHSGRPIFFDEEWHPTGPSSGGSGHSGEGREAVAPSGCHASRLSTESMRRLLRLHARSMRPCGAVPLDMLLRLSQQAGGAVSAAAEVAATAVASAGGSRASRRGSQTSLTNSSSDGGERGSSSRQPSHHGSGSRSNRGSRGDDGHDESRRGSRGSTSLLASRPLGSPGAALLEPALFGTGVRMQYVPGASVHAALVGSAAAPGLPPAAPSVAPAQHRPWLIITYLLLDIVLLSGILMLLAFLLPRCLFLACAETKKKRKAKPKAPSLAGSRNGSHGKLSQLGIVPPSPDGRGSPALLTMRCKVPEGLEEGEPLLWKSPSGRIVSMKVPDGSVPGDLLEFQVPDSVITPSGLPRSPGTPAGTARLHGAGGSTGSLIDFFKRKPSSGVNTPTAPNSHSSSRPPSNDP